MVKRYSIANPGRLLIDPRTDYVEAADYDSLVVVAKAILDYYADERNDESWHTEFQALHDRLAIDTEGKQP